MRGARSLFACIVVTLAMQVLAAAPLPATDEFFIISSVDIAHGRLVLKRPTEVTVVMNVTATTPIRGERDEALRLAALRAGDTIYAVVALKTNGELTGTSIRRGPMTVEELHRRYLGQ